MNTGKEDVFYGRSVKIIPTQKDEYDSGYTTFNIEITGYDGSKYILQSTYKIDVIKLKTGNSVEQEICMDMLVSTGTPKFFASEWRRNALKVELDCGQALISVCGRD